jgi:hypothetical protein
MAMAIVTGCATVSPSGETTPWPAAVQGRDVGAHVGERVSLFGREAREIWQHLVGGVPGKRAVYFDPTDGWQLVVHVASLWDCPGDVELAGTVREERGASKRPAAPGETKVDDTYVEYALDVESWRCAAAGP